VAETDTFTLTAEPEFGVVQAAQVQAQWLEQLAAQAEAPQPWALDLSAVQEIDSAGLQLLLALRRALVERGQSLTLLSPSAVVAAALASFGLSGTLEPLSFEGSA
jgi:anti-anti-sigma factor